MKILNHKVQRIAEEATLMAENIGSIDLMERAGEALTSDITHRWNISHLILVFAGVGNNGGDALSVARMPFVSGCPIARCLFQATRELTQNTGAQLKRPPQPGC